MPELPEVETVMRGLIPVMQGQVIEDVWCGKKGLRSPFPEGLAERLSGAKIEKLDRRAKYILVYCHSKGPHGSFANALGDSLILSLHLGMSGRIRILAPQDNSQPEKHDHFKVKLASGHEIVLNDARRFGMVFDLPSMQLPTHKAFSHLGPEPLSAEFDADGLAARLGNKMVPNSFR